MRHSGDSMRGSGAATLRRPIGKAWQAQIVSACGCVSGSEHPRQSMRKITPVSGGCQNQGKEKWTDPVNLMISPLLGDVT